MSCTQNFKKDRKTSAIAQKPSMKVYITILRSIKHISTNEINVNLDNNKVQIQSTDILL